MGKIIIRAALIGIGVIIVKCSESAHAITTSKVQSHPSMKQTTMPTPNARSDKNEQPDRQSVTTIQPFLAELKAKYAHQPTFLQAVEEMALSLADLLEESPEYRRAFEIMTEPERTISFRVPWMDDHGELRYNRGWRVEFNSALGPYKGGLRFHPSVDEGILKFLGFEQTFKNALTGLPMGGGKGGSDFDPKGKSPAEVRRFCESFMTELFRYLHPSTDVPAGDIGVGGREIGYMYGQYKRLTNKHGEGVLTGKSVLFGGSPLRPEATGYGLVYMAQLAVRKSLGRPTIQGMRCAVSGSGNVAQFAAQKLLQLGAIVVSMSDSGGVMLFDKGMTDEDWEVIAECKNVNRGRLASLEGKTSGRFMPGSSPWLADIKFDLGLPCATQNEVNEAGAKRMVEAGVLGVIEGANLPTNIAAQKVLRDANVLYIPGKASNAGGVGVSGLEMSQNAQRLTWRRDQVDSKLHDMMSDIYDQMVKQQDAAAAAGHADCTLEQGANRAGFVKVAAAMTELGWLY